MTSVYDQLLFLFHYINSRDIFDFYSLPRTLNASMTDLSIKKGYTEHQNYFKISTFKILSEIKE